MNVWRSLLVCFGVLSMISFIGPTPQALAIQESDVGHTLIHLENGMSVLVQEDDRFPLASVRLYVHTGSAYEAADQAGISHLLEHMVFKGTEDRAPGDVARDIEAVGGYVNAATSFDYTVYLSELPAERWQLALDVFKDMIFGAAIDPEELEREKQVVLSELQRGEDNPSTLLFKDIQKKVWPETSYAWPVIGYPETVTSIRPEDVKEYIERQYQPQSMLLVVVGKVSAEEAVAEAERVFGGLRNTRSITPPNPLPLKLLGTEGPQVTVRNGPYNKTYLSAAFPAPGFRATDATGLEVLAHLLGGDYTARLYRTYKYEKQLVDTVSMSYLALERVGMLYLHAVLDSGNLETFWSQLMEEFASLSGDDFSEDALDRAKLNMEDSLYQTKETLGGLASKLGFFQFFEGNPLAEENYLAELRQVNHATLDRLITSYLAPSRLSVSTLMPAEATEGDAPVRDDSAVSVEHALAGIIAEKWTQEAEPGRDSIATSKDKTVGEAEYMDLGNGRTLVLLPDPTLPYTAVSLHFRGGDLLITEDKQGLSELLGRVLPRGVQGMSTTEIQDYLSARAADLNTSAGRDLLGVSAKFPTRFSEDVLDLVVQVLTEPTFPKEEVAREKNNQLATIMKREDQPMGRMFRELFPQLFMDHPYGYYHMGQPDDLEALTREDVLALWEQQRSQPWVMSVCGDFDREIVVATAERLAEELPATDDPVAFTAPAWRDVREFALHMEDRNQAHLLLVFPVPGQGQEDGPGLRLLRNSLGGMSGPLFRTLRDEQGLGYSVSTFLWQSPESGFLAFYIGTSPEKLDQAREGFRTLITRLHETPMDEESVERGKNQLSGDYYREHQSLLSRSTEASGLMAQGLPHDLNREAIEAAQSLTAADLKELANKYLQLDKAYEVTLQP
ncbi:insulinase family protein [Oceanidesulfovibrio indonesiensis]|uniref:Insulinase family protein n=2 Tax=Oceanidesulfovibrio indonesiensis TaxID=54767 RepID=A0A7M3MDT0_9BACT|nr:insulinase family protein [Oceanidesulfovibrio indonesiensis]